MVAAASASTRSIPAPGTGWATRADPTKPTVKPVPYVGVQFVAIPEFAGIATTVGQIFSAALAGEKTADEALAEAQDVTTREMTKAVREAIRKLIG